MGDSANGPVREFTSELPLKSKRRKTTQHTYSSETRANMGKCASLHRLTAA